MAWEDAKTYRKREFGKSTSFTGIWGVCGKGICWEQSVELYLSSTHRLEGESAHTVTGKQGSPRIQDSPSMCNVSRWDFPWRIDTKTKQACGHSAEPTRKVHVSAHAGPVQSYTWLSSLLCSNKPNSFCHLIRPGSQMSRERRPNTYLLPAITQMSIPGRDRNQLWPLQILDSYTAVTHVNHSFMWYRRILEIRGVKK